MIKKFDDFFDKSNQEIFENLKYYLYLCIVNN